MTNAVQIHVTNCTAKLHAHIHEARKIVCNNRQEAAQGCIMEILFCAKQALPLNFVRIFRLTHISPIVARSPARWSRDVREMSDKTSGEISCGNATQFPSNSQTMANSMPLNGLARQLALHRTWARDSRVGNLRDNSQHDHSTVNTTAHKGILLLAFNHDV
jgi:hypothetical protein